MHVLLFPACRYNAGPSILKTFGAFTTGGRLLYWPNDDGQADVRLLPGSGAQVFDAKREMLLFDGCRCHAVSAFTGERYSLVFFTACEHHKVTNDARAFLSNLGAIWPTDDTVRYFQSLLAPPRGNSKSIRRCFGYEELPAALQCGGTSLAKLGDAVPSVLSFLVTPLNMSLFCALSHELRAAVWDVQSWLRTTVDARGIRPRGGKAHRHWQVWRKAKHVISGDWALTNVALLMTRDIGVWRWSPQPAILPVSGKVVWVSQNIVPRELTVHLEHARSDTLVGFATASDPQDIVRSLQGVHSSCVFIGAGLTAKTTLLLHDFHILSEEPAPPNMLENVFVALSLDDESIHASISSSAQRIRHSSLHGESAQHKFYCAAIRDADCKIAPCWTLP